MTDKTGATMTIDYDTIRAAADSLSEDDNAILHLANLAPLVTFGDSPLAPLVGDNGLLNQLGKAVAAWLILTGEGFTPKAIESAKATLARYGIEQCDGCRKPEPNVGPWSDGRRLCGGCKIRMTLARPGFVDGIARDLKEVLGCDVTIEATDEDGLPIVPKGEA